MSATTDVAALQPSDAGSAAWLAAFALGLAYSESPEQHCLTDLRAATRGHPGLLEAAYRRLDGAEVAEPAICEAALHLLDAARGRVQQDATTQARS